MNIVLIGFRGTGKSCVGKAIARCMKRRFIDADDYLEQKVSKTIKEIFSEGGEKRFRQLESEIIEELTLLDDVVIAAGGGAVLKKENVKNMKRNGFVVLLEADIETIHKRLTEDTEGQAQRPGLTNMKQYEEIRYLLEYRRPYYKKAADYRIDTTKSSVNQLAEKVILAFDAHVQARK
ncbi:MAG TPA: shikimate kinase [Candidatus Brocadiales bacterium]|nr:shikimate kinase [Candidatus Brocadiales bacterium]